MVTNDGGNRLNEAGKEAGNDRCFLNLNRLLVPESAQNGGRNE